MSQCSDIILLGLVRLLYWDWISTCSFRFQFKIRIKISLPIAELIPDLSSFTHGTTTEKLLPDRHHTAHNRQELNYNIFSIIVFISSNFTFSTIHSFSCPCFPAGLYGNPLNVAVPVPSFS